MKSNRKIVRHIVFVSMMLSIVSVQAQTLYRWVDDKGRVHYTDRPPEKKQAVAQEERLDKEKIAPRENLQAQKALANKLKEQSAAKREQEEALKRAEQRAERERIRERDCNLAQESVRQLSSGQRLAVVGERGERQVLDEKSVQARLAIAKEQEIKACAPLPADEEPVKANANEKGVVKSDVKAADNKVESKEKSDVNKK